MRVAPESTQANAINVTIPSLGVVTGEGTISPSGALNFTMNANLSGGSEGGVIQRTGGSAWCALLDRRDHFGSEVRAERESDSGQRGQAGDLGQDPYAESGRETGEKKNLESYLVRRL